MKFDFFKRKEKVEAPSEERVLESSRAEEGSVLEHNLRMMGRPMQQLIIGESAGGNANTAVIEGVRYPCVCANFCTKQDTGEIVQFDNPQFVSPEVRAKSIEGRFKIALDFLHRTGFMKIVSVHGLDGISPEARQVIEASVAAWNDLHAKK
ncbi:MAG: hypothetical protein Q7S28_00985 [bacterium]|nr:hypothetical protein [bacterium]